MKAGFRLDGRWKILEGKDLITIWLDEDGFSSQRIKDFETKPVGHSKTVVEYDKLIPMAEGQVVMPILETKIIKLAELVEMRIQPNGRVEFFDYGQLIFTLSGDEGEAMLAEIKKL